MPPIKDLLKEALSKKTCMKHPVAVVFETVNFEYVLGWNGAPSRGKIHKKCLREGYASGEGMHLCPSVHAEIRAITYAARHGINLDGSTLYLNGWFPCDNCAKAVIEAGVKRIITPDEVYSNPDIYELIPRLRNQSYNFEMAEKLIREAGLELIVDSSLKDMKKV